jgi:carbon monoxide dehydrogenase subunit G
VDLNHSFTVPASLADTWRTFEDIESVAGCFPGAVVTSVEGDDFKGTCKVKLGPIAMVYSGSGTFLEKDEAAGKFVIDAKGKDKRGNGTAGAVVTALFAEDSPGVTRVDVATDLAITGKPAQFGRGVIEDISNKLLQQFVTCLQDKVGAAPESGADAGADESAPASGEVAADMPVTSPSADGGVSVDSEASAETATPTGSASQPGAAESSIRPAPAPSASSQSGPRPASAAPRSTSPADNDALDLGATVLPILARTYGPQAALALVFLVLGYLLGRRRS